MRPSALLILALLLVAPAGAAQEEFCLECHGAAEELATFLEADDPAFDQLVVDGELFARSVHSQFACGDCHFDYDDPPHGEDAFSVSCGDCHEDAAEVLSNSVHGGLAEDGEAGSPSCTTCHGVHDVLRAEERESRLNPLNIYQVCGQCHFSVDPATASVDELLHEPYTDDAHARGILRAGLTVSATCVSCHGGHDVHAADDPESPVARQNVDVTCGKCHVGVVEQYRESVHHLVASNGEHQGATCSDCHKPHEVQVSDQNFLAASAQTCTACHEQRAGSFRLSQHGKMTSLGFRGDVATCASCHGNHSILPADNPASTIHADNIVATCAQCHEGAHAEFTNYLVHADPKDAENFPELNLIWVVMNGLLIGTLILGGLHALLWLIRSLVAGDHKRPPPEKRGGYVRRWPRIYVVCHIWMMTTVLLLASTGFPLHFADRPWALGLMNVFGGPEAAGWVHRFAAISLVLLYGTYFASIAYRAFVKREKGLWHGPNTMLPRVKDVADFIGTVRWFVFLAPRPKYDRWTYWEKFDFWAATWGLFVIGLSGLMLWFPVEATLFVPGWFLNAAVIIHGIEALLDIAFIFTVHVFHANLRPDKFPMDTMFLSGRITEAELKHERPLEYERLMASGGLGQIAARPPTTGTRVAAYILGSACLALGFFFVIMMVVAVIQG